MGYSIVLFPFVSSFSNVSYISGILPKTVASFYRYFPSLCPSHGNFLNVLRRQWKICDLFKILKYQYKLYKENPPTSSIIFIYYTKSLLYMFVIFFVLKSFVYFGTKKQQRLDLVLFLSLTHLLTTFRRPRPFFFPVIYRVFRNLQPSFQWENEFLARKVNDMTI